jgi:hypothetical protein
MVIRERAKRKRRAWYRRNWRPLLGVGLLFLTLAALTTFFVGPGTLRGFLLGVFATAYATLVIHSARDVTDARGWHLGTEGETLTADTLRWFQLRRLLRGERWHVVHSIHFRRGDVDHVLLGPGGVYAIETKFRTTPTAVDRADETFSRAMRQASEGAQRMGWLLEQKTEVPLDVVPVVMIWGSGFDRLENGHLLLDGVRILDGREARRWRPLVKREGLDPPVAKLAARQLRSWARERATQEVAALDAR